MSIKLCLLIFLGPSLWHTQMWDSLPGLTSFPSSLFHFILLLPWLKGIKPCPQPCSSHTFAHVAACLCDLSYTDYNETHTDKQTSNQTPAFNPFVLTNHCTLVQTYKHVWMYTHIPTDKRSLLGTIFLSDVTSNQKLTWLYWVNTCLITFIQDMVFTYIFFSPWDQHSYNYSSWQDFHFSFSVQWSQTKCNKLLVNVKMTKWTTFQCKKKNPILVRKTCSAYND